MPEYLVTGFHRSSGNKVQRVVLAADEEQAAKHAGIVVETVQLKPPTSPEQVVESPVEPDLEQYEGLTNAGLLLRATGVLGLLFGLVMLIYGIGSVRSGDGVTLLSLGILTFIAGALIFGVGEGLGALRDIAIAVASKP